MWRSLAGGGRRDLHPAAGAAAQQRLALGLAHAAPDPVGLGHLQRVVAALGEDGARVADRLGAVLALGAGAAALAVRVVENLRCLSAARAVELPIPEVRVGSGKLMRLRHE